MEIELIEKIELRSLDELRKYANNPKEHPDEQIKQIADSITEFGFVQPIVINESGRIIIGHGRYEACIYLRDNEGMIEKVPVIEADHLSEAQEKALRIADNEIAKSGWEDEKLGVELEELEQTELDVSVTGFEPEDIDQYIAGNDPDLDEIEQDEEPEPPEEADTDEGDLIRLGKYHLLLCGDATDEESHETLALAANHEPTINFTSPPYNVGDNESLSGNTHFEESKYEGDEDNRSGDEWKTLVKMSLELSMEYAEYSIYNIQPLADNMSEVVELMEWFELNLADIAIWKKSHTAPQQARNVMNSQFELFLFFTDKYKPNRQIKTGDFRGDVPNVLETEPQRKNEFSDKHAATFPVEVPAWAIKHFTSKGDWVMDNFAGTGTTMVACHQLDRKALLIEKEPRYCDLIIERYENLTGNKAEVIT